MRGHWPMRVVSRKQPDFARLTCATVVRQPRLTICWGWFATRQAILTRAELDAALARTPGPVASRIAALTARGFRIDTERGSPGMICHDPLAVGVAIEPSLVSWEPMRIEVGSGGETRRVAGAPNCRVARAVDTDRFLGMLLARLCPPAAR